MDTFMFFEPQRRLWSPRRDIGTFGPLSIWDPWSTFSELDGPVWRPCVHAPSAAVQPCQRSQALEKQAEQQKSEGFHLALDAAGYRPEEVSVKLNDGVVTVRAHHREKTSSGLISSSLVRRVRLPDNVNANELKSRLTRSGQLILEAPPATAALEGKKDGQKAVKTDVDARQVEPAKGQEVQLAADANKFQVALNVSDFKPEEVSVKVDGGVVTVDAVHETTSEEGCSSFRMLRKFTLPPNVNPDQVTSRLTQSGQLMVEAPTVDPAALTQSEEPMETGDNKVAEKK